MPAAFVSGFREGLILEKPINPGESLREGTHLDIDAELRLVREAKNELTAMINNSSSDDAHNNNKKKTEERKAMKELGFQRARHFGYGGPTPTSSPRPWARWCWGSSAATCPW